MSNLSRDTNKANLNDVGFPKFHSTHIEFFIRMLKDTETQRLNLDMEDPLFKLQAVSLQAIENQYKWLLASIEAVEVAERKERIFNEEYNPEKELQNLDEDELTLDEIESLL